MLIHLSYIAVVFLLLIRLYPTSCYRKKITYARNLEQIKQFVDSSTSCRQFTRVKCKGMLLFKASKQYGFLHDRNGISMSYFGGGPRDGKGKRNSSLFGKCIKMYDLHKFYLVLECFTKLKISIHRHP